MANSKKKEQDISRTPAGSALNTLVMQIFKVHSALTTAAPGVVQDERISAIRWRILGALRHEAKTPAQLGRELALSRQITLWNTQFLADEGLVVFEPNPDHQRAYLVLLTPEGKSKLDTITQLQTKWINALADGMKISNLETTFQTLEQLCDRLPGHLHDQR